MAGWIDPDFSYPCKTYNHPDCEWCDCWCHDDDNTDDDGERNFDEDMATIDFFDEGGEA